MSEFTLALGVLGGLTLAGVIAHGAWTSHRNKIRQPDTISNEDLAYEASRLPSRYAEFLESTQTAMDSEALSTQDLDTEVPANRGHSLDQVSAWMNQHDKKPRPDSLIDSIATIALEQDVSGEAILANLPSTRRVGSKTIQIEAQFGPDAEGEYPKSGQRYSRILIGVQLANRTGALTDIEFSEFLILVHRIADSLGGSVDAAEMRPEIQKARELDQFASAHDAQFSLHLFPKKVAWSTGFVQQCATRLGFVAGSLPGRLVLPASQNGAAPLLAFNFDSQAALSNSVDGLGIRHASLTLDLPQVDRNDNPFLLMREIATMLAASMDAVVADEMGTPVTDAVLDMIGQDLQQLYDRLQARELDAGSALARRLFS